MNSCISFHLILKQEELTAAGFIRPFSASGSLFLVDEVSMTRHPSFFTRCIKKKKIKYFIKLNKLLEI